jgi:hypothetical protein
MPLSECTALLGCLDDHHGRRAEVLARRDLFVPFPWRSPQTATDPRTILQGSPSLPWLGNLWEQLLTYVVSSFHIPPPSFPSFPAFLSFSPSFFSPFALFPTVYLLIFCSPLPLSCSPHTDTSPLSQVQVKKKALAARAQAQAKKDAAESLEKKAQDEIAKRQE